MAAGAAAGCCVLAAASAGCGGGEVARTRASFSDGGVRVSVTLERTGAESVEVTATLSPQRAGFHVYSLTLPDGGVDGLGVPTRLTLSPPLVATAEVTASARPYDLRPAGLDVALPVYPDGAVTLRVPARVDAASTPAEVHLHLAYGACSTSKGCLVPVRDHPVAVALP